MPELPEVETVVRGLRDDVIGRTITGIEVNWSRELAGLSPIEFADRLIGQQIEGLHRRGKYIVFELTHDAMLIHLKMSGRLYVAARGEIRDNDPWTRVAFQLDDGRELRFSDARKFGRVYLVAQEAEVTGKLGPEPLSEEFTLGRFRELISARRGVIKPLLLNQAFVAGVGNIYADEALWLARIDPRRNVDTLKPEEIERLHQAIRAVLEEGIEYQGTTLNWYRQPDGTEGGYQTRFKVYDREDEPCPECGAAIHKIWLGQRGTHFCPACQC